MGSNSTAACYGRNQGNRQLSHSWTAYQQQVLKLCQAAVLLRASTAVVSSNSTVSFPVATRVVLDPWKDEKGIYSDAQLTLLASTAAKRTVKFCDNAGKPLQSCTAAINETQWRTVGGAYTGAVSTESPSFSPDDNRHRNKTNWHNLHGDRKLFKAERHF